jgi:cobalamin synthase
MTSETVIPQQTVSAVVTTANIDAQILKTAGQRRINIVWEVTQAIIALGVIGVTLYVNAVTAIFITKFIEIQSSALMQLNVMAAIITGFYFGRTNHQRVGGVGGDSVDTGR